MLLLLLLGALLGVAFKYDRSGSKIFLRHMRRYASEVRHRTVAQVAYEYDASMCVRTPCGGVLLFDRAYCDRRTGTTLFFKACEAVCFAGKGEG